MIKLAKYAASAETSRGRVYQEPKDPLRNDYQRDRDRIIHSASFRRLEYKTQVFINHEGDMYRTRLTHSIEVAQIGRTIARALSLNEDLTEAICLAHDLGHTPFGHLGQRVLNQCMSEHGGFEHNLQSLRIVDLLEKKYADFPGLNLTFETREGILKHCSSKRAHQLGEIGERFLNKRQAGLEAQIANIADQIAYNHHDIDDGLRSGLIKLEQLTGCALFEAHYRMVRQRWPKIAARQLRNEVIRRMIHDQVSDLIKISTQNLQIHMPSSIEAVRLADAPIIAMSHSYEQANHTLRRFLHDNLYRHAQVEKASEEAKNIILVLFSAYLNNPTLMHGTTNEAETDPPIHMVRKIADYIAGMTDRFAIAEYQRIQAL